MSDNVNMVFPYGDPDSRAIVPMCPKHRAEAEREGWVEINQDHFLANAGLEFCERCDTDEDEV